MIVLLYNCAPVLYIIQKLLFFKVFSLVKRLTPWFDCTSLFISRRAAAGSAATGRTGCDRETGQIVMIGFHQVLILINQKNTQIVDSVGKQTCVCGNITHFEHVLIL